MFEILEKKGQTIIRITRGDSGTIWTTPTFDANNDKVYDPDDGDYAIELGDNDYVLFMVGSLSGRKYISKLLTKDDYNENHILTINLTPTDTVNLQPYSYTFSFTYFQNKGENAYTYAKGQFEVLETVGTVKDLPKEETSEIVDDNL